MGSTSEKTRINQKEQAELDFNARKEALTAAGITEKAQKRDPKLRAAKAALRKANKRIAAIESHAQEVVAAKEKKASAPKAKPKGADGKKKAAKPAKEAKPAQKGGDKKAKKAKKK